MVSKFYAPDQYQAIQYIKSYQTAYQIVIQLAHLASRNSSVVGTSADTYVEPVLFAIL